MSSRRALLAAAVGVAVAAWAAPVPVRAEPRAAYAPQMVQGLGVFVRNRGNRPVHFSVRPEGGLWGAFSLDSGQGRTIACDGCDVASFEIRVSTAGTVVGYTLDVLGRYEIYWNGERGLWDVARIPER